MSIKNTAAKFALATTLGLGAAGAPMAADAGVTEQAINAPSPAAKNITVASLQEAYSNYKNSKTARDGQAQAIAEAAKAGGSGKSSLDTFLNAAQGVRNTPVDPQRAAALGLPTAGAFPFNEKEAASAIALLTTGENGRTANVVVIKDTKGVPYNIVSSKFRSSKPVLTLAEAMTSATSNGISPRGGYATDSAPTRTGVMGTTGSSNNALNASTDVTTQAAPDGRKGPHTEPATSMVAQYCDEKGCRMVTRSTDGSQR